MPIKRNVSVCLISTPSTNDQLYSLVVDKLVDELVWHYPAIVLGARGKKGADLALKLAGVMARILELAPTYRELAGSPFQGTERTFDEVFIQKHARLCTESLQRRPSDPHRQEGSARVRAAMRTIVVAGGERMHHPDDDPLIWRWRLDWADAHDPQEVTQCFVQYLEHCRQEGDLVGLGDALLVTNDMWRFGSDVQKAGFLHILISSLGAGSTRLRHIAIRVARDNGEALFATENTQHADIGENLITFSQALMTSISLDIASGNGSSDQADTTQDPANDKPSDDLGLLFHDDRDWRYVNLIFTLSNSSDCMPSIAKDGHLDRCLLLLRHDISHPLLAVIFLRIEADKRVDAACLNDITEEQWRGMTYAAWDGLRCRDWKVCVDILPALAERMIKYLSDSMELRRLRDRVVEVLDQLKMESVREEIRSAVGTLLEAINERQR